MPRMCSIDIISEHTLLCYPHSHNLRLKATPFFTFPFYLLKQFLCELQLFELFCSFLIPRILNTQENLHDSQPRVKACLHLAVRTPCAKGDRTGQAWFLCTPLPVYVASGEGLFCAFFPLRNSCP